MAVQTEKPMASTRSKRRTTLGAKVDAPSPNRNTVGQSTLIAPLHHAPLTDAPMAQNIIHPFPHHRGTKRPSSRVEHEIDTPSQKRSRPNTLFNPGLSGPNATEKIIPAPAHAASKSVVRVAPPSHSQVHEPLSPPQSRLQDPIPRQTLSQQQGTYAVKAKQHEASNTAVSQIQNRTVSNNPNPSLTKHQAKVINGIRHELNRLQPNDADARDQPGGRKLRSQEATRFKSDLSAYFLDYDEVIGNEPKEQRTPVVSWT